MVSRQLNNTISCRRCQLEVTRKYNIGVDIGNTSVGWAVVETSTQKIIRKGNKKLWGVRLFEEANTAAKRRDFRSTRRRYDRRRYRIKLLQEEFSSGIKKVDENFFTKLKESFYHDSDIHNKTIFLSEQERKQVREYHKQYKTIYHLREALMKEDRPFDIRLVYLAIHHIIKYRGNFLYSGDSFQVEDLNIPMKLKDILEQIEDGLNLVNVSPADIDFLKLEEILLKPSKNDRKIKIQEELKDVFPKSFINEFIKMINGNKFNFAKMLDIELEEKVELSFKSTDYDDNYDKYEKILNEQIELLESLKELYDMLFLKQIFKGSKNASISSYMVEKYKKHEQDLKYLKDLLKVDRTVYNKIFRTKDKKGKIELCVYDQYINNTLTNAEFIKKIDKYLPHVLEKLTDRTLLDQYTLNVKNRMLNGEFMPRITEKENGKYPYQLNRDELIKIIEKQGKYYPFLLEKYDGKTYRIVRLLEFRIPYYVGPLTTDKKSPFAWMIRKDENTKINPYNFDEIIDKEQTAEKFIKKMISHCTYILKEKAMPTNSILYSKFKVMNELKQISVNGIRLDYKMQRQIYEELFLKNNKIITDNVFKHYLNNCKDFKMYSNGIYDVKGYSADNKFANDMKSYIDFFGEDGVFAGTNYNVEDAEKLIEWITIFEDKDILESKVRREYPLLSDGKINKILKKKYSGWGSLSNKLLTEKYYVDKESGNLKSIMDLMEETNKNFMQILNDEEYKFQDMIAGFNQTEDIKRIDYSLVENLATSPSTKRGIYQSLKVIDEIIKYMGYQPESIVIEMARSNDKKMRKDDRKSFLTKLYKNMKGEIDNYNQLIDELGNYDQYKMEKISPEKLFLYFIQEGKSLYSGIPLNIEDLESYEVDHIIPQTLIKDDSIDNKALVLQEENQRKAANYVLPKEYREKYMQEWWKHLLDKKLISQKKYFNLRRSYYRDEDIAGFIQRQLVETRQITKHVANILHDLYKDTKIVYLKANLSHNYREKYKLYKFREINDYHHAHDAYLAAVLGEYKEKYLKKKVDFEKIKELNDILRTRKDYKSLKYGYVINSLDDTLNSVINRVIPDEFDEETGELLEKKIDFDVSRFNKIVENTLYQNDILISKKTEIKTGEFYNQTKNKKGAVVKNPVKLKKNLPTKLYGSYTSLNPAYAVMIEYTKKNNRERRLVGIPTYILVQEKNNPDIKIEYIKGMLKLQAKERVEIVSKPIPFYSLLNWNGKICYLTGASDKIEVCNAKEFHFSKEFMIKHKESLHKLFNQRGLVIEAEKYESDLDDIITYIVEKLEKEYQLYQDKVLQLKEMIHFSNLHLLTLEQKEKTIIELMCLLKCDSQVANFKFLSDKYSSAFGKKNSRIIMNASIITKSSSGIKEISYEL